jgi:hypothetical protein
LTKAHCAAVIKGVKITFDLYRPKEKSIFYLPDNQPRFQRQLSPIILPNLKSLNSYSGSAFRLRLNIERKGIDYAYNSN